MCLLRAAPAGRGRTWRTWRTTFCLWSLWRAKGSERQHSHSKNHEHRLHSFTSFLVFNHRDGLATPVHGTFARFLNATAREANTAASVLSKFKALSEAITVPMHPLVARCIREVV
jgi:hypothetical protein